jgi:mediator of RNA polymerase II transcription subunit 17
VYARLDQNHIEADEDRWANFAAGNALNLVNLLISRDPSKALDNAFTQPFKEMKVPLGSFGIDRADRVEDVDRAQDIAKRRELVMKGSRMEALDWATDSLLQAATELEAGIRKETKYWEEVLSISEKGWSLQRTRRDARNAPFAVRYGLPEGMVTSLRLHGIVILILYAASNHFKARGLAPLRMNKDGGIILDSTLSLKPKTMRVRISDNEKIVGMSHLPPQGDLDKLVIEQSIQLARDSLFEEELFHEISIESRGLRAYGVELQNSVICIMAPTLGSRSSHRKILIDCTSRDNSITSEQDNSQHGLARNIAEGLRLLLAHEHRMRLHRRSRIPPPLTQMKTQQSGPPLLRTMLGLFTHLAAVDTLHAYLKSVVVTLKSAGMDVELETSRESSWAKLTNSMEGSSTEHLAAIDQLLTTFTRPFDGTATISLPSTIGAQAEQIVVATRTFIGQPTFGAEHKVILPPSLIKVLDLEPDQPRQFKFSSTEEVQSYIDWIVSLDIAHSLISKAYTGRVYSVDQESRVNILSKGSRKDFAKEDSVLVCLDNGMLTVTATANTYLATGTAGESFAWDGKMGKMALLDKVKSWIQ